VSMADLMRAFGINEKDIETFDRKRHSRTRPESKRRKRKMALKSRRRNRP